MPKAPKTESTPDPAKEAERLNREGVERVQAEKTAREKLKAQAAIVPKKDPRIC